LVIPSLEQHPPSLRMWHVASRRRQKVVHVRRNAAGVPSSLISTTRPSAVRSVDRPPSNEGKLSSPWQQSIDGQWSPWRREARSPWRWRHHTHTHASDATAAARAHTIVRRVRSIRTRAYTTLSCGCAVTCRVKTKPDRLPNERNYIIRTAMCLKLICCSLPTTRAFPAGHAHISTHLPIPLLSMG